MWQMVTIPFTEAHNIRPGRQPLSPLSRATNTQCNIPCFAIPPQPLPSKGFPATCTVSVGQGTEVVIPRRFRCPGMIVWGAMVTQSTFHDSYRKAASLSIIALERLIGAGSDPETEVLH